ncbi:restriction endonuclease subunit S [Algoriphagus halophytocola]|uniref:restriction endonuclease subunit S n=1 Tax=Algoriphagus halophytocola TaxID=2991499 RepID=UPI0022DD8C32|nr:restriction endonuclease subunit S [Algoriphagus sp. TR-M9]WBL44767.1 restriction endonuclease subunit S [Algoriphagus sp. TR-M9]
MLKRIKIGQLIREKKAHSQTGPFGTQLKASEYVDFGIPVINVRNIGMGDVRSDNLEYLNDSKALELKSHRLKKDDIVFGRKGAVERHSFITENENGWIQGSDCIRLRILTDEFNPKFISYFFRTYAHQQWMINLGSFGATMGSLNQEIISKIEIPDIPRSKQDEITTTLSAYDDLIENNNQRIKLLEEMAEEISKEWFVRMRFPATAGRPGYQDCKFFDQEGKEVPHGTPGALPEGWRDGVFGDLVEVKKGRNITASTIREGKVPVVAGGLTPAYYHDTPNTKSPTITVSASGANSGYVNLYYEDIWASDCSYVDSEMTDLLYFLYSTLRVRQKEVFHLQKGSAQPHVYPKDIMGLKLNLPENELLKKFENLINPFYTEIGVLKNKNQILQETRDLLLPRLISGKLDVSDLGINEPENMSMAAEPEGTYQMDNRTDAWQMIK